MKVKIFIIYLISFSISFILYYSTITKEDKKETLTYNEQSNYKYENNNIINNKEKISHYQCREGFSFSDGWCFKNIEGIKKVEILNNK